MTYINFIIKTIKKQPHFLVVYGNSRNFAVSKRDTGRYQDKVYKVLKNLIELSIRYSSQGKRFRDKLRKRKKKNSGQQEERY